MEILTAQEVAALLRISTRQVYQLAKESDNPSSPLLGFARLSASARLMLRLGLKSW